ncbi:MAG: hypothetical protein ACRECP_04075 [Methylocella sp.]
MPETDHNEIGNPHWVWARRPLEPDFVKLAVHAATFNKIVELGSRAKIGEFWGLVHGNPGLMPDEFDEPIHTSGLKQPVAIYRGLRRPMHYITDRADSQILVYVTTPEATYHFKETNVGNGLVKMPKPIRSVFTTFVSFAREHIDDARTQVTQDVPVNYAGVVLFWEWTESSRSDSSLPFDAENRYSQRLMP